MNLIADPIPTYWQADTGLSWALQEEPKEGSVFGSDHDLLVLNVGSTKHPQEVTHSIFYIASAQGDSSSSVCFGLLE